MCEFQWTMMIVKKFNKQPLRLFFNLIFFSLNSLFLIAQNPASLSKEEQTLDNQLSLLKTELLINAEKNQLPIYQTPFSALKPLIENSELYKTFQKMPKGALLHSHSGGIANAEWLINKAAEYENCYVFTDVQNQQNYLYGQLMIFKEHGAPNGFVKLKDFLKNDSNAKEKLHQLLTLKRNNLSEYLDYWVEFEKRFQRIGSLLTYRPIFKEYYQEAFQELINDNVQHVEIRYIFGQLFDDNKKDYPIETAVLDLKEIEKQLQKTHPEFTLKIIYTSLKFLDKNIVEKELEKAYQLKKKYPDYISGFDLVANEATGNSVAYFNPLWKNMKNLEKKYGVKLPLYLHAGESCSLHNQNISEIPMEDNKRIGHALNLIYFPKLMEKVKQHQNLIEISPISNQILGYVSDLRNHPARVLLANNVNISINSDDPGVFGYDGLSYDFWMAYVNWDLTVKDLKKLIFNSIEFSSLNSSEKQKAKLFLQKEWNTFVKNAIQ